MSIEPITSIDRVEQAANVSVVDVAEAIVESEPVRVTHAATCTGFDPAACQPTPYAASIAATAAAQDYRLFTQRPRAERR